MLIINTKYKSGECLNCEESKPIVHEVTCSVKISNHSKASTMRFCTDCVNLLHNLTKEVVESTKPRHFI